ncbi:MAG: DUF4159 domain-containing protein [Candidatus Nealsonbacteria bacterium]|nr:DUF4159 domain-containing protein [Candidatus Nealsonbacteria bacterium]
MTASTLCFPLGVLAIAGLTFALAFEPFCYPWLLQTWPDLTMVYPPWQMPPVFVAWAIACGACSAVLLAASLAGFLFRRPWALSMLRKAYVVVYLLCAVYFCMAIGVIGRVAEAIHAAHDSPPPGFALDRFYWSCQWLAPAVPVLLLAALLHVCSWRRDAVTLYHRTDDPESAAGDRIIENVRTHGSDPRFRKSVYGSALAHLLVIIIIPYLLTFRGGCIRPYRVPKGSGNPTVAMMKIVQKKKEKKRKKYILSIDSSIVFTRPELDESEVTKKIDEETQLTYVADTSAAHGAMGTGGGNKPGWADGLEGGQIRFIRLEYDGPDWDDGMDPSQGSDANFLAEFRKLSGGLDCARDGESHPISHLRKYPEGEAPPFVYMTGSNDIRVSKSDIETLREYIRGGGMLIADAGSKHWDRNFRAFVRTLFPGNPLLKISDDDPIFQIPFTFPNGPPALWFHGGEDTMGVKYRDRWGVFYFPGDMNDAWKTGHSGLEPNLVEGAFHLGTNIVYYSITHYLQETRKHRK